MSRKRVRATAAPAPGGVDGGDVNNAGDDEEHGSRGMDVRDDDDNDANSGGEAAGHGDATASKLAALQARRALAVAKKRQRALSSIARLRRSDAHRERAAPAIGELSPSVRVGDAPVAQQVPEEPRQLFADSTFDALPPLTLTPLSSFPSLLSGSMLSAEAKGGVFDSDSQPLSQPLDATPVAPRGAGIVSASLDGDADARCSVAGSGAGASCGVLGSGSVAGGSASALEANVGVVLSGWVLPRSLKDVPGLGPPVFGFATGLSQPWSESDASQSVVHSQPTDSM